MHAICVTLPETPERMERSRAHFAQAGLTDVEFFTGINARVAGLATSHAYEIDNPGSGWRIGEKGTGCWLSFYMMWASVARMPDDAYLILEDDAQLCDGFMDKWAQAMRDVPSDYDFLFLGHCCMKDKPKRHVAGDIYESKGMMCGHAYVLRRSTVTFLLQKIRKCWAPLDIQLAHEVFPLVKVYAVMPRIVSQFNTDLAP